MEKDNEVQADHVSQEIQELRERIAYMEGRREGSARMLAIILPVAVALLAIMSFATLSSRINTIVDQQIQTLNQDQRLIGREFLSGGIGLVERPQRAVEVPRHDEAGPLAVHHGEDDKPQQLYGVAERGRRRVRNPSARCHDDAQLSLPLRRCCQ